MILAIIIITIAAVIAFLWPWVDPYLLRHDARERLLDRLEEEWDREAEPIDPDWRW